MAPVLDVWPVLPILAFSASVLSIGCGVGEDEGGVVELATCLVEATVGPVVVLNEKFDILVKW